MQISELFNIVYMQWFQFLCENSEVRLSVTVVHNRTRHIVHDAYIM